ncbi:MAG: TMEM165/GDT1 family protein [Symbiobacterium sp.]|uniref:TMEM165/GDT1 family protein n=1 Tax=Symbiobacterium sp. TaxID=1971213 RepID=UPI0034648F30
MEWKSALATFLVIFLAELGDKTQLMVMSLSARSKAPHMIFLGAAAALVASSLLAVVAGDSLLRHVPVRVIRLATGTMFMFVGGMLVLRAIR